MMFDILVPGRAVLAVFCFAVLAGSPALAQQPAATSARRGAVDLRGQVVKQGEPVPGIGVTLHRVAEGESGVIAQGNTDAAGQFSFALPPVDSGSFNVFFTTTEYSTVRYFGRAIHPSEVVGDYTVQVYDTASVLPEPIRLSRRDMVLVPQPGGGWEVDEIVRLHNPNQLTLLSAGTSPSWDLRIPKGAESFEVAESEIPADQIQRMEDRVLLTTPLTPGHREIFIRYRIPAARNVAVLPFGLPTDTFNLFVRQPSPKLEVVGVTSTDMVTVGEEQFLRYAVTGLAAGSQVEMEWESVAPPVDPVVAAVVVTMLLLAAGTWAAMRRNRGVPADSISSSGTSAREMASPRVK